MVLWFFCIAASLFALGLVGHYSGVLVNFEAAGTSLGLTTAITTTTTTTPQPSVAWPLVGSLIGSDVVRQCASAQLSHLLGLPLGVVNPLAKSAAMGWPFGGAQEGTETATLPVQEPSDGSRLWGLAMNPFRAVKWLRKTQSVS